MTAVASSALYSSFSSKVIDRDGSHSHSCKRFLESSIILPPDGFQGDNKGYVGQRNGYTLSRLHVSRSLSKCKATRLHPVSSVSSIKNDSYSSQTAESE